MYAVVDIETTGSRFGEDRITEVAIYQTDGESIQGEWSSLVQPGVAIPTYITALTGIDDHMLVDAPSFADIAADIEAWTADRILVAHNAAFDYGFLRREFERCGLLFQRKRLCTVKVSRKIFPGLPSYSLGRLCKRLGIPLTDRHRAFGDAQATALLLNMLVDNDRRGVIGRSLKHGSGERNLPPNLTRARFLSVPERTGVYYLYNERGQLLYIGKARNMRARLTQHFGAAERNAREARLRHLVHDVDYAETGSELIALLLESAEIKKHRPPFNAAQKQWQPNFGLVRYSDQQGYERLGVVKLHRRRPCIQTFPDLLSARRCLERMVAAHGLCPQLSGLQKSIRAQSGCHDHRAGLCQGACAGRETRKAYNQKVQEALRALNAETAHCLILGRGRHADERSVVAVENGHYLGYGYYDPSMVEEHPEALRDVVSSKGDNPDVQRILSSWLRGVGHHERILPLPPNAAQGIDTDPEPLHDSSGTFGFPMDA